MEPEQASAVNSNTASSTVARLEREAARVPELLAEIERGQQEINCLRAELRASGDQLEQEQKAHRADHAAALARLEEARTESQAIEQARVETEHRLAGQVERVTELVSEIEQLRQACREARAETRECTVRLQSEREARRVEREGFLQQLEAARGTTRAVECERDDANARIALLGEERLRQQQLAEDHAKALTAKINELTATVEHLELERTTSSNERLEQQQLAEDHAKALTAKINELTATVERTSKERLEQQQLAEDHATALTAKINELATTLEHVERAASNERLQQQELADERIAALEAKLTTEIQNTRRTMHELEPLLPEIVGQLTFASADYHCLAEFWSDEQLERTASRFADLRDRTVAVLQEHAA
jgi:chromosome segregation ATPase